MGKNSGSGKGKREHSGTIRTISYVSNSCAKEREWTQNEGVMWHRQYELGKGVHVKKAGYIQVKNGGHVCGIWTTLD